MATYPSWYPMLHMFYHRSVCRKYVWFQSQNIQWHEFSSSIYECNTDKILVFMFGHMWTCELWNEHDISVKSFDFWYLQNWILFIYIQCVEVNGWILNKPFHDYGEYVIIIMATICRRQSPIRAGLYSLHNGLGVASVVLSVFVSEKKRSIFWARVRLQLGSSQPSYDK